MEKSYKDINEQVLSSDFKKFCKKELASSMTELEACRIKYMFAFFLIGILSILLFAVLLLLKLEMYFCYGLLVVVLIFGPYFISCAYKNKAKAAILPKLLSYIGNFQILNKPTLENYIATLDLFDDYNNFNYSDCLKGIYKLLPIDIMEISLKKITGSGKNKRIRIIFKGLFIKVPCSKKYNGKTIIKRNSNLNTDWDLTKEKVNLEDIEFESLYDVYSTDQIEARYLITSAFMNRMVKLAKKGYCKNLTLSFEKGNVNIALSSCKDWFEVPFFKPATNIANYRAIVFELISVLKIIDSLKLDQNIGM